jgi:hypothetical protein
MYFSNKKVTPSDSKENPELLQIVHTVYMVA